MRPFDASSLSGDQFEFVGDWFAGAAYCLIVVDEDPCEFGREEIVVGESDKLMGFALEESGVGSVGEG